jgi:outer membrane protein OmpA-like peptidoglycan-associated protein
LKKTIFLTFLFFHFSLFFCYSQSTAEEIETLLSTKAVTYAVAARFLLEASDVMVTSDLREAFRYASAKNWVPNNATPSAPARLDGVSLLLMRSFNIKGGIMYSITKSSHYAYRELAYKNIIMGRSEPAMKISGERLLFITLRILSLRDKESPVLNESEQRRFLAEEVVRHSTMRHEALDRRRALAAELNAKLDAQQIADVSVEVTDEGVMLRLSNIQFLADSNDLAESEKIKLREIANILKTIPERSIQVAGHTALAGSARGRLTLSRQRAQAVASYLVSLGARESSEVTVVGYGADVPIADNATNEGMAANRRVEIIFLED